MKIALFFGSFNPVHTGHTQLAEYLIDKKLFEEIWFVVSPCNPLKNQADLLDEYIRLDMLVAAIAGNPHFKACDIEFELPVPSYTIDTLHALSYEYPENQFALIIGSDNALVFDKWKNPQQILTEYPVYVYPRRGFDFAFVADLYPQMQLLDTPYFDISSTEIRAALAQKKDVTQWLHPSVLQYITENNLYNPNH
ncbi:MAG: nicotinate (nicotinamide) nucleotide adenylyltransferase [Paludibacter sp.]